MPSSLRSCIVLLAIALLPTLTRAEEPVATADPARKLDPEIIRLHMIDGSIITGKLSVKEIAVQTPYGSLNIPITEISAFTPGLDSHPDLAGKINSYIQRLGASDFAEREAAQRELSKFGPSIRAELERHLNNPDAETRTRVQAILEEIETALDDDDSQAPTQLLIRPDTVQTKLFTIAGKIQPRKFDVASTFGTLSVNIADVRSAHRTTDAGREEVRKTFEVAGTNLIQTGFKNPGIRVEKGDKITISASGNIIMTPWGNRMQSNPDGAANLGMYQPDQIPIGMLVARIGDNGPLIKVGSQSSFVAERSGKLLFAVAMMNEYAANQTFPGQYNVKVRVTPK